MFVKNKYNLLAISAVSLQSPFLKYIGNDLFLLDLC